MQRGVTLADLAGLWHRDYLRVPGIRADETTHVSWLQAGPYFADLRQPADLPPFDGVRCVRDLSREQLLELARQEAFAGTLTLDGGIAEWHRQIDFQPATGIADRARVTWDGAALMEFGTERDYAERWSRRCAPLTPAWGTRLVDRTLNRLGLLVRAGDILMFARDRRTAVAPGSTLAARLLAAVTLEEQQDLIDLEISIGRIEPDGRWRIDRSTLPYKAGREWYCPVSSSPPDLLEIDDLSDDGEPVRRLWHGVAP